ncbi:MAG: metallophosphatase [Bacteroidota bacterium]
MEELNKLNRRKFIKQSGLLLAGVSLVSSPLSLLANGKQTRLTILHTNDWHSRIDPFDKTDKNYAGLGGAEVRAAMIKKIRETEEHVLLLDAGDIFQGTPYFNFYGGELEYKLMSQMGYDCVTLGNHDFDNGLEGLYKQMPNANFDFVNCNYDFADTLIENKIAPYKIYKKGNLKIGVTGVGIELDGLVPQKLYGKIKYNDPVTSLNKTASFLKLEKKCDLVICLSHLGYKYNSDKVSDVSMVPLTSHVDLVLGGHTHTFLKEPTIIKNALQKNVIVNQVGWAGLNLGRIDFTFNERIGDEFMHTSQNVDIVDTNI